MMKKRLEEREKAIDKLNQIVDELQQASVHKEIINKVEDLNVEIAPCSPGCVTEEICEDTIMS